MTFFTIFPSSTGGLKHLKYLNISFNPLDSLPASICDLMGLEALDFIGCSRIEKLLVGFGKLIQLRRLGITTQESYLLANELQCLKSLEDLAIIDCPNLKCVI